MQGFVTYYGGPRVRAQSASAAGNTTDFSRMAKEITYLPGNAAPLRCDVVYSVQRTVAALTADLIDIVSNTFEQPDGDSVLMAFLNGVSIEADEANTGNLVFGNVGQTVPGIFTALADGMNVVPGGSLQWTHRNGLAITATTADVLRVFNPHATLAQTYAITLTGRTV